MSTNEWGLPTLKGTVSMTKAKNAIKKADVDVVVDLHNVRINGQLRGCSGFLTNPATGRVVYLNTELTGSPRGDEGFYRDAKDTRDYTGGRNRFAPVGDVVPEALDYLMSLPKAS